MAALSLAGMSDWSGGLVILDPASRQDTKCAGVQACRE